jgi:hypothetical protein
MPVLLEGWLRDKLYGWLIKLAMAPRVWSDGWMANSTRHAGRWTLEDRFASPWHYLPVEVPPGTAGLRVELEYERAGGAVLDLGCLGPHGFRGWSGGARESFVITRDGATPGYLPGELETGTWQVMIGVHRVPPDGVRYQLTAETWPAAAGLPLVPPVPPAPPPRDRPARRVLPASAGRRWLAGDLHAHTVHSDGVLTVSELAVLAVERGLDFLAVTDHNTVSHHAELPAAARRYGITLIPGQEVTTDRGHAGAFGDLGWIDFRREPDDWLDATARSLALELARPALVHPAGLVAGLGSCGDPGGRQRLAPAGIRRPARAADHLGAVRGRRAGRRARRSAGRPGRDLGRARRPGAAAPRRRPRRRGRRRHDAGRAAGTVRPDPRRAGPAARRGRDAPSA